MYLLKDGPTENPKARLILAHGAGAPMDSEWMNAWTALVAEAGVQVIRFEFPYMARRRETGKKGGPDRMPVLQDTWRAVINEVGDPSSLYIGGKSMGGRVASMIADEIGVAGLVCLGYPFHPPGKPEKLRTEHLKDLKTRTLILQGERDTFGKKEEVVDYDLSSQITINWLPDGDHGFQPRK